MAAEEKCQVTSQSSAISRAADDIF